MTESLWKHLQYFFSTTKIIFLKDQSMLWGQPLPHVYLVATASLVVSPVTLVTQSHRNQAARFNKVLSFSFCSSLKHKVTLLSWDNEIMCQQLNWNWEPCILKLVARSTAFNRSLASLLVITPRCWYCEEVRLTETDHESMMSLRCHETWQLVTFILIPNLLLRKENLLDSRYSLLT